MAREEAISVLLGYASIVCWLGAQLPQIIVNWRRSSADGLALPFLASWLLGDSTNLVGCLLTDQLPFQTYLAVYFVCVDVCLVAQYFYYDALRRSKFFSTFNSPSAPQSRTSLLFPSYSPQAHALPQPRSRSYSIDPHLRAAAANMSLATAEIDARHHDPDDLDAEARWRSRRRQRASSLQGLPESVVVNVGERQWGSRSEIADEAVDAESDSPPSPMIESFHSEGGGRGRGKGKHVSWSRDSPNEDKSGRRLSLEHATQTTPSTVRGRQPTRSTIYDSPVAAEAPSIPFDPPPRSRRTSAASTLSAAASRRGAGIVFLGVFVLFSLSSRTGYRTDKETQGDVLSPKPIPLALDFAFPSALHTLTPEQAHIFNLDSKLRTTAPGGDTQRLIGRISAWTCTTLYITSRLPQIWKNFARKSVEGLSMYLFTFAFLGNFFYVLSILASPKMDLPPPRAAQFLRDSVPYLIGSGGTLLFDVTIVLQSFVYTPNRRARRGRSRRKSLVGAGAEEERGLLSSAANE